jgi:hypothetical protein
MKKPEPINLWVPAFCVQIIIFCLIYLVWDFLLIEVGPHLLQAWPRYNHSHFLAIMKKLFGPDNIEIATEQA